MRALLVIDVQNGPLEEAPHHDIDGVIARINQVAAAFRQGKQPVIFVRHDGSAEGYMQPGTRSFELDGRLVLGKDDLWVQKTANDSFYGTNLEALLKSLKVDELVIAGCATDFCVNATIHNALTRDFNTSIIADGHSCSNRPGIRAEELVAYYNWLWPNLSPTKGSVRVEPYRFFIE